MNKLRYSAYLFLAASIVLSAAAQLFLKVAMNGLPAPFQLTSLATTPSLYWLLGGLLCYGFSMVSWLVLLAKWPLSQAYPMLSLSYVLVYIGASSWPLLHEEFTLIRSIGLLIVVAGVILVNKKAAL